MATMNKPTYQAIQQHSPTKPALVFVSSRRQTRMTALDLIGTNSVEFHKNFVVNKNNEFIVIEYRIVHYRPQLKIFCFSLYSIFGR